MVIDDNIKRALEGVTIEDVVNIGPQASYELVHKIISSAINDSYKISQDWSLPNHVNESVRRTISDLLFVDRVLTHIETILTGKCKYVQLDGHMEREEA